jgi:hypothetical protein
VTNPTGEAANGILRLDFDRRVMMQFRGSAGASDAGVLAYRELDDALGSTDAVAFTARPGHALNHRWSDNERAKSITEPDGKT